MGERFVVSDQTVKISPLNLDTRKSTVHDFYVIVCIEIALLKKCAKSSTSVVLPDENGPLCKDVLSSSI